MMRRSILTTSIYGEACKWQNEDICREKLMFIWFSLQSQPECSPEEAHRREVQLSALSFQLPQLGTSQGVVILSPDVNVISSAVIFLSIGLACSAARPLWEAVLTLCICRRRSTSSASIWRWGSAAASVRRITPMWRTCWPTWRSNMTWKTLLFTRVTSNSGPIHIVLIFDSSAQRARLLTYALCLVQVKDSSGPQTAPLSLWHV